MTFSAISLMSLLDYGRASDALVARDGARWVTWAEFAANVAARRAVHRDSGTGIKRRVLMVEQNPLEFLAEFLAVLGAGFVPVIPPNFKADTLHALAVLPTPDDVPSQTLELYTSGSSGEPKCIRKTLVQLEAECRVLENCWGEAAANALVLATVPHHHIYGLLFRLLWPLLAGRPFDTATIAEPTALVECLAAAERTLLVASPAQLSRLPELLDLQGLVQPPQLVFSSGGPLQQATALRYVTAWGVAPIEVFGSTESGGVAWRQQNRDTRWQPLPGVTVDCASDGALLVQSTFLPDAAPLRLEDAVCIDADGCFTLQGRLDRIVKLEEKRLALPEMESWLAGHRAVVAVALAPLNLNGRALLGAVVVLRDGLPLPTMRQALVSELREHLRRRYDDILLPRRWRFVMALPYNERGKLACTELLHLLEAPR
jgi:acyl-coenzyme A synthetase/AMP-(fatty) acid ligase